MAKLTRRFFWDNHDDFGEGWNPNPNDDESVPVRDFGFAHDALEHIAISRDGWTPEDEFMAFGAMIFIRVNSGYFSGGFYPAERVLGMDLGRIAIEQIAQKGFDTREKTRTREVPEIEGFISELFYEAKQFIRDEYSPGKDEYIAESIRDNLSEFLNFFKFGPAWIREGYLRAKNGIFRNSSSSFACDIFRDLEEIGNKKGDEGDRLTVRIDTESGEVSSYIESAWEWNPEYY